MKHRNAEMAWILKNDPARLRGRTVETERRKQAATRSRRKQADRREMRARAA
jgi:hypothetical protein